VLVDLEAIGVRSYISEPDRGRRNWEKHPEARDAVYRNAGGFAACAANACCRNAVSGSNGPSRTSTGRAVCGVFICAVTTTSSSAYSCSPAR
jgi:hypothetical protein